MCYYNSIIAQLSQTQIFLLYKQCVSLQWSATCFDLEGHHQVKVVQNIKAPVTLLLYSVPPSPGDDFPGRNVLQSTVKTDIVFTIKIFVFELSCTYRVHYTDRPVNAVQENQTCLL